MKRFVVWRGHLWIALGVRLYLGGVFLMACYHKILDPKAFALDVATYQFLPLPLVNLFALILPWVELLAGAMLVLGLRVQVASLLTGSMMAAFMVALGWALHLGLDMSCGCFASQAAAEEDAISWWTMARDSLWLVQSAYVFVLDRRPIGLGRLIALWRSS
jgi:uncharacterized membrane protein YphA (DoxX/SURF4 family)